MSPPKRQLHVYLLLDKAAFDTLDTAQAVADDLAAQLNQGLHALTPERIKFHVITADAPAGRPIDQPGRPGARCPSPWSATDSPLHDAGPRRTLAEAVRVLHECICRDVKGPTPDWPGDWAPVVVVATDGRASGDWEAALGRLRRGARCVLLMAAAGSSPDLDRLRGNDPGTFRLAGRRPAARLRLRLWPRAELFWHVPCSCCGDERAGTRTCDTCGSAICHRCAGVRPTRRGAWLCPKCGGQCSAPARSGSPLIIRIEE